jgi:hypothetical protein
MMGYDGSMNGGRGFHAYANSPFPTLCAILRLKSGIVHLMDMLIIDR